MKQELFHHDSSTGQNPRFNRNLRFGGRLRFGGHILYQLLGESQNTSERRLKDIQILSYARYLQVFMKYLFYLRPTTSGQSNNFRTTQRFLEHETSEQPKDFWTIQQILTILQRCLYPPRIHPLGRLYSLFISNAFVIVIEWLLLLFHVNDIRIPSPHVDRFAKVRNMQK